MAELVQQPVNAPAQIDEKKKQKLLELVRGRAVARPTDLADDEVMVWPTLVGIEAVSATIFLAIMVLLSVMVNAPLLEMANPNQTPNPAKAPWYFLHLQEMLLHMDPALAGIIIPTLALGSIAAIPYIDRSPLGVGILGTSSKGRTIIGFTAVYTTIVLIGLVLLDEASGRTGFWLKTVFNDWGLPEWSSGLVMPSVVVAIFIGVLVMLVKRIFNPTTRELIIALYTGFFVTYWVLGIIGTSFRGPGQDLMWPWDLPLVHH